MSVKNNLPQVLIKYLSVDIRKQRVEKHHGLQFRRDFGDILISHLL